jgi:uncharacterized protein (DUF302 family)
MSDEAIHNPHTVPGLVTLRSPFSVSDTSTRLESLIKSRGLRLFARIDFAADAAREGLAMPPMVQLVFGNPRAGTPLLLAAPTIGLDLPLKTLVWEDADGTVWLAYHDPAELIERHQLPSNLIQNIAGIRGLVEQALAPEGILASQEK